MNSNLCRLALTIKVRAFFVLVALMSTACQSEIKKSTRHSGTETNRHLQSDSGIAKSNPIVVSFLGDVIIHERLRKREELTNEGYQSIWSALQRYIDRADISYANLEGPVAPELGGVSGFPLFNYPEEIIPTLKDNGFDIVSTANNHALDRRADGIRITIENLTKNKLAFTGTISSASQVDSKKETWWGFTPIKNTNVKLAWLACTEMTNGNVDKEEQVLYCYKNREKIKILIQALRAEPDVAGIIITPHWGEEEKFDIAAGRRIWAQQMINEGALAVVGSHPHVVQKLEDYTANDGRKSFIAYSVGNFVSNQPWTPNKTSMMLLAKLHLNAVQKLEVTEVKYISLWMTRTIEKDNSSKFRLSPVWDLSKVPADAALIWKEQLGLENRIKSAKEADLFFD